MYEIYQTKAFVLKKKIYKESDERILFFTKDFGIVWGSTFSSKKDGSKMRNFLQELSFCEVFLVQGKTGYKVTGGKFLENIYFSMQEKKDIFFQKKINIIKNIFNLLEKFFQKNEKDENIFSLLEDFIYDLNESKDEKKIKEIEVIFISKVFFLLGYLDEKDLLKKEAEKSNTKDTDFSASQIKILREKINENISKIAF